MEKLLVLSILIEKYKLDFKCEELPKGFDSWPVDERIELLKMALDNNVKLEYLLNDESIKLNV